MVQELGPLMSKNLVSSKGLQQLRDLFPGLQMSRAVVEACEAKGVLPGDPSLQRACKHFLLVVHENSAKRQRYLEGKPAMDVARMNVAERLLIKWSHS